MKVSSPSILQLPYQLTCPHQDPSNTIRRPHQPRSILPHLIPPLPPALLPPPTKQPNHPRRSIHLPPFLSSGRFLSDPAYNLQRANRTIDTGVAEIWSGEGGGIDDVEFATEGARTAGLRG